MHSCRSFLYFSLLPLIFLSLIFLSLILVPLYSQTAATDYNLHAKVQVVVVDVVVTDSKGEPATGLQKGDFEVLEEGNAQTIASFEKQVGAPLTEMKLPPMPPNVYTNFPVTKTADSVNVLLLDALNTPVRDQTYVHQQMLKYLGTIPPGTRVAVFTLASRLRMIQGVTSDTKELLAVLKDKQLADPHPSGLLQSGAEKESNQEHVDFLTTENLATKAPDNLAMAAVDPVNSMKQFLSDTAAFQTELRVGMTLDALQQLARVLVEVPGRKNVAWFSGAFPTGILPDSDLPDQTSASLDFQGKIRKTTDLLAASQVAIYPIAAEGLAGDSAYEADAGAIGQQRGDTTTRDRIKQMRRSGNDRDFNHVTMEQVAKDTGGQAFYDTNGLNNALTHVIKNGSRFYTLTCLRRPIRRWMGSFAALRSIYRRANTISLTGAGTSPWIRATRS